MCIMIRENILIAKFKKEVNIMRKTFSLILSVIMVLSLFTVGAFAAEGTAINSTEDFKNMTADGKYYLAADITVNATYAGEFTGTFDGNGKTVTVSVPMFEKVKGTVKNLNVKGAINADSNAGAVAISAEGATFEAIKNAASVTAAGHAAGIVALAENAGITIKNCSNSGAITTTGTASNDSASGIVAYILDAPGTVFDGCSNSGKITVDSTATKGNNQSAAGISGRANAKSVGITVKGKSCHGASPFAGIDPLLPACNMVGSLQSIITRHIHPVDAALITVGSFHSGTAGNIIPDETVFSGIIRVLDMQLRDSIKSQLRELCENIAKAYGASCVVDYQDSYPTLINNQELLDSVSEICREKLGDKNILLNPKSSLGADDFAYFCHAAKGLYFNLGCHTPGTPEQALHSAILNPDENCIRIGILSEVLAVLKIMGVEIE